jgi:hypothetical protein
MQPVFPDRGAVDTSQRSTAADSRNAGSPGTADSPATARQKTTSVVRENLAKSFVNFGNGRILDVDVPYFPGSSIRSFFDQVR